MLFCWPLSWKPDCCLSQAGTPEEHKASKAGGHPECTNEKSADEHSDPFPLKSMGEQFPNTELEERARKALRTEGNGVAEGVDGGVAQPDFDVVEG